MYFHLDHDDHPYQIFASPYLFSKMILKFWKNPIFFNIVENYVNLVFDK
jgi:hypothetical protein